jgi:DNA helicase HerA-like ATPase
MDTTINLSTDGHAWDANQFVSELTAILGVRGSGKSNTASALVEELLDKGVPIVVVDIEGEYWGLRSDYQLLIVGDTRRADLSLNPPEYAVIAEEPAAGPVGHSGLLQSP